MMRARDVIISAVVIIAVVSTVNMLTGNNRLFSTLPATRVEVARREALQKPFHSREHRLERHPRLESTLDKRDSDTNIDRESAALQSKDTSQDTRLGKLRGEANKQTTPQLRVHHDNEHGAFRKETESSVLEEQKNKYHIVASVDGRLYTEWQVRICYYQYKKVKAQYPDSAMGGFTRLLHSGKADNLTSEIPTVVVDGLPAGVDQGYVVLNRPYAFFQWVTKYMPLIPEDYVLMAEPDHIFYTPPPLWATPSRPAAYPFFYINPKEHEELISKFNDKNVAIENMAHIGRASYLSSAKFQGQNGKINDSQ